MVGMDTSGIDDSADEVLKEAAEVVELLEQAGLDAKEQAVLVNRSRTAEERVAFAEKRQAFAEKVSARREAKDEAQKMAKALLLRSLESAGSRRDAIRESIKQAAEREVCKASEVKQAVLEKRAALAASEKRATFEKLQAAEARRSALLLARTRKPEPPPPVIEVEVFRGSSKPSAALLKRLSSRPCYLAATSDGRRAEAAARRALQRDAGLWGLQLVDVGRVPQGGGGGRGRDRVVRVHRGGGQGGRDGAETAGGLACQLQQAGSDLGPRL